MGRLRPFAAVTALILVGTWLSVAGAQLDAISKHTVESFGSKQGRGLIAEGGRVSRFGFGIPGRCHNRNFGTPYRVYQYRTVASGSQTELQLIVTIAETCIQPNAYCCKEKLDHLLLRTAANLTVVGVTMDSRVLTFTQLPSGLRIQTDILYDDVGQKLLRITFANPGLRIIDMCPNNRVDGYCDYVAYNGPGICCPESVTLNAPLEAIAALPSSPGGFGQEASPSPPPSPPPPPPPPVPFDHKCCIDDPQSAPLKLTYTGAMPSVSQVTYEFQLEPKNVGGFDNDGSTDGNKSVTLACSNMRVMSISLLIYDDINVRAVFYNKLRILSKDQTDQLYYFEEKLAVAPGHRTRGRKWLTVWLFQDAYSAHKPYYLRLEAGGACGNWDPSLAALCPAPEDVASSCGAVPLSAACEYVVKGFHGVPYTASHQSCCPHGLTTPSPPESKCCVADVKDPPSFEIGYRSRWHTALQGEITTVFEFVLSKKALGTNHGPHCSEMNLDVLDINIFRHLQVVKVLVNGAPVRTEDAQLLRSSRWLSIPGLNREYQEWSWAPSFTLEVHVAGLVTNLCPLPATVAPTSGCPQVPQPQHCEFVAHGPSNSWPRQPCCPHLTSRVLDTGCDCNDDNKYVPWMVVAKEGGDSGPDFKRPQKTTSFSFDVEMMDMQMYIKDQDNSTDKGHLCADMPLDHLHLLIHANVEVEKVELTREIPTATTAHETLRFDTLPYTDNSKWLRIFQLNIPNLGFERYELIPKLLITTKGHTRFLCPARHKYYSNALCELVIFGGAKCCTHTFTSTEAAMHQKRRHLFGVQDPVAIHAQFLGAAASV